MAGLAVAARHGLEMENALEMAKRLYVDINIFSHENEEIQRQLPQLPTSCWESAEKLLLDRHIYEKDGVFPAAGIDGTAKNLMSYNDKDLSQRYYARGMKSRKWSMSICIPDHK
jgi:glutamine synthetase